MPVKQPFLNKILKSPCSPKSLHQSWHQLVSYKSIFPVKLRASYSPDDFVGAPADRDEIERILAIYSNAYIAPTYLTYENLVEAIQYRDKGKLDLFRYLYKVERRKILKKFKSMSSPVPVVKPPQPGKLFDSETEKPIYGVHNINLILNYTVPSIYNIYSAAIFGPKLVIDFSYDHLMRPKEQMSLVNQVRRIFFDNIKQDFDVFDISLTNFTNNQFFLKYFLAASNCLTPKEHMFNVYKEHVHEVFSKDQILYLSPDGEEDLTSFDYDKIYVIGGLVDTFHTSNYASIQYCKSNGIKSVKLPLNSLPVNVYSIRLDLCSVFRILNEIKNGVDVKTACMKYIAIRKTRDLKYRGSGKPNGYIVREPLYNLFRTSRRHKFPAEQIIASSTFSK